MKKLVSCILAFTLVLSLISVFTVSSASYTLGDVNSDDKVNSIDSFALCKYITGTYEIQDTRSADLNFDKRINSVDSALLKKEIGRASCRERV